MVTAPLDDAGAQTDDRYHWQAAMAAADCLSLYLDALESDGSVRGDCADRIVCEWHEDWVVVSQDEVELVSAKHRDPSAGAYTTIPKLVDDGGLAHLFNRWAILGEKPLCRLVTSGGLGSGDPQRLLAAADSLREQRLAGRPPVVDGAMAGIVSQLRESIARYSVDTAARWAGDRTGLPVQDADQDAEVARFLTVLTIRSEEVQRAHVGYAAPAMYAKPVLDRMGRDCSPDAVWHAVLGIVRERMRARGALPTGELPVVLERGTRAGVSSEAIRRTVETRTVTMQDVHTAIATVLAVPRGFAPLPPLPPASPLEAKMDAGECSGTAIERAASLRLDYQDFWRDRESFEPASRVERHRLEQVLHGVGDWATASEDSGPVQWRRIQDRLAELELASPPGMDANLALGGVCDLANRCKVWFSPRFDVDAVLRRDQIRGEGR